MDYERAGVPIHVLFVCATSITDCESTIRQVLDLGPVVNVRELVTGQRNVPMQVVGRENDAITRAAHDVDELGLTVNDEVLTRAEYDRPRKPPVGLTAPDRFVGAGRERRLFRTSSFGTSVGYARGYTR